MLVIGHGGTGKSVLIDAITETFAFHNEEEALAKCGTSGISSTHVNGSTVHFWAGLGVHRMKTLNCSKKIQARRKQNILGKKCLIIDEMSMLYDTLLTDVAKVVSYTKKAENEGNHNLPFAGMHVILFGDFHQFPPVAKSQSALYSLRQATDPDVLQGRLLYKQFKKVYWLRQQIRIKDKIWEDILNRVRVGQCDDTDIKTIRSLILNNPDCPPTDFSKPPWSDAVLITTRHTVREAWNAACLSRHCRSTGNRRYIVPAEDFMSQSGSIPSNNVRLRIARLSIKATKNLSDRIEIAVGMKAMILANISTEGEVANGTRGTISDIILDPREDFDDIEEDGTIKLRYPPATIIFQPEGSSDISAAFVDERVSGNMKLGKGQVPISPCKATFTVIMADGSKVSIHRRQYAITGGYAFTDFKSQAQTIKTVIVDLRDPPTGKISPFSAYVTLSRSRGRDTIRLLSDFDEELFKRHPSADLAVEMERLTLLAATL